MYFRIVWQTGGRSDSFEAKLKKVKNEGKLSVVELK